MYELCLKCKGRNLCKPKPCALLEQVKEFLPKITNLSFDGYSNEPFVGHFDYPNVFIGSLALREAKNPPVENWFENKFTINDILALRASMLYARTKSLVNQPLTTNHKLLTTIQEIALSQKPTLAEFFLKDKPKQTFFLDSYHQPIGNPAPLVKIKLEENPKISHKVEYVINDDLKAEEALLKLYNKNLPVTYLTKLLSVGLLGIKKKLVPTRWSITAVDLLLSKNLLKNIRTYPIIDEYCLFHAEYLGNHYEILFLPQRWSFEVIETHQDYKTFTHDYEDFTERKTYASQVAGAYYANRLAVAEYLEKIKRQASVIIFREISKEYWAPCGVGILREVSRAAFENKKSSSTLKEALGDIKTRLKVPLADFQKHSILLNRKECQTTLHVTSVLNTWQKRKF